METNSDEQLLDHQDWKHIIINTKNTSNTKSNIVDVNKTQEYNQVKKIEQKADNDNLKHTEYPRVFRVAMVRARTNTLNMTQKQLATRLNLPEKIIKDIEAGKAIYNHQHYNKIKRTLKI